MPFTLTMPKLSPTMEEGTITKWRKREGDFVKAGDVLIEVATDKATVEHSALDEGWLRKILIKEGGSAIVNQAIAIFTEKKEESIEGYRPEGVTPQVAVPASASAELSEEINPAAAPVRPAAGPGLSQPAFVPEPPLQRYQFQAPTGGVPERITSSPLARKLAKEKGIDLSTVKGTGPQGRITSRDLELGQPSSLVTFGRREAPSLPPGTYEEIPLSPMRKIIGQRLQEAKTFIPHFYVTQEIDAERLISVRNELAAIGIKITYNDLVIRACALALKEHPEMNTGFNSVTQSIIQFKTIDIAIAVSLESGLITPIIRHADFKNVGQISSEVKNLAKRAREGKLAREEYVGGSFTVSNIGMFGVGEFKAIINPPQAAILAVGGILDQPIVKEGKVVPGKVMKCTLSADHRVLDGTDAAKFMKTLQKFLENASLLLL
jgi:pyruvate dehydrogenase E2 component (dihydrolipoamide acetyltransferase)